LEHFWYLAGLFLLLLLEELGIPMPFVTSSAMVALGTQQHEATYPLWTILLIALTATLVGSTALYTAGRLGARPLLIRYGRLVRLSEDRIMRLEMRVRRKAFWAILGARFLPGMTQAVSLLAGTLRVPLPVLSAATLTASASWTLFWWSGGYLGYSALSPLLGFLPPQIRLPVTVLSLVLLMMALAAAIRRLARIRMGR